MASYLPNLQRDNIALYTIPIYWMISLGPRAYNMNTWQAKTKKRFDGRAPRDFATTVQNSSQLDEAAKGRMRRAEAATANGFENFGPFTAAMVAGSAAQLDPLFMNSLTIGYLVSRVVYNYVYIHNDTGAKALVRVGTYMVGMAALFTIFAASGWKLNAAAGGLHV